MTTDAQLEDRLPAETVLPRRTADDLGRKGKETRRRLMNAARELLETTSAVSMTAAAITRTAGASPPTFYVYFDDVADVVLALAVEASRDIGEVMEALALWRQGMTARDGATAFVRTFRQYYDKHRSVFGIRNMEADRGDARFLALRAEIGWVMLEELGELIRLGRGNLDTASHRRAVARATIIYSAVERLAATENFYPARADFLEREDVVEAAIAMLVDLVTSA